AGAEIGDRLAGLDLQRVDYELRLLFRFPLAALQPDDAARSHDVGDLATEVELADAVRIVRRAELVMLSERLGMCDETAQQEQGADRGFHGRILRVSARAG